VRDHIRNASTEIDNLEQKSRSELRLLWEEEFAGKAPPSLGRDILALEIAYARQERRYGGLARPVAKELDRLLARVLRDDATDAPKSAMSPLPRTGTILVREWRGTTHQVAVVDDGFLWNGKTHGAQALREALRCFARKGRYLGRMNARTAYSIALPNASPERTSVA
jgi:Protein of unknown function (DUF2924)